MCFGGIIPGSPTTPFTTKAGTPAAQLVGGLWWGVLPDCKSKGKPTQPCVAKRNKSNGNVVIVFDVPDPWDLRGYTG